MKKRGFNPDSKRKFPRQIFIDNNLYNDWNPSLEDYKIIRNRIKNKINQKSEWYRNTAHIVDQK